eukprot:TRINITY_DN4290_c0_g1_i1.p1 TRINITY_DN4290_c0_g1~~TRINITY_DN4290_c0_g1_i1.p1  ORF type:complete len:248 (+),score=24.14 TRINITY_DN4290_c0_g1_i1:85-828(+)
MSGELREWAKRKTSINYSPRIFHNLPRLVEECFGWFDDHPEGLSQMGLFRISGSFAEINAIYDSYDISPKRRRPRRKIRFPKKRKTNSKIKPSLASRTTNAHVVAGVLKKYLRELDIPLLTFEYHEAFMSISNLPTNEWVPQIRIVVHVLPKINRLILKKLLHLLHKVSSHEADTKMPASNLALIFAPAILRSETNSVEEVLNNGANAASIVEFMITKYQDFFAVETTTQEITTNLKQATIRNKKIC